MKTFHLKVDTVFEAEDLDDACFKLIEHVMDIGEIASWEVDAGCRPTPMNHAGSFSLAPEGK